MTVSQLPLFSYLRIDKKQYLIGLRFDTFELFDAFETLKAVTFTLNSMFRDDVTTFIDEMGIDIPDLIICDYIL